METNKTNKFFVYEGKDLKAAQPTFNIAMKFFKAGRKMYQGTPDKHKLDITKIANKINIHNYI